MNTTASPQSPDRQGISLGFCALLALCLHALLCSPCCEGATESVTSTAKLRSSDPDRVVVLVIDGPRWSETWGDPTHGNIPHRAGELATQALVWHQFFNDGPTYTNAGHTAITTGIYQEINNKGNELPAHPGLFQRYLKQSGAAATDAWIVTSKDKLEILADCNDPEWKGTFRCSTDCGVSGLGSGYRDDAVTMEHVYHVLDTHHPHLLLINLKEPDASGHAKDWNAYLKGIRDTDAYAADLHAHFEKDPIYAGHTAFFITNDHGRHLDTVPPGFAEHGCSCTGCRRIELMAFGPGFARGVCGTHRNHCDLATTIASLLKVELPGSPGTMLSELRPETASP